VCLIPVALAGPERSQDPLFIQRISSSADLEVVGIHQPFERGNIEVQVGKEPLALRNEDLLERVHPTTYSRRYRSALGLSRHTVRRLGLSVLRLLAQLARYAAAEEDGALPLPSAIGGA
jgi:hypothetical protein